VDTSALAAGKPLEGRLALVTGANRGLGLAIAEDLARNGAMIAAVSRDAMRDGEALERIAAIGGVVKRFQADLRLEVEIEQLVDDVNEEFGRVDIIVNNAGITREEGIQTETLQGWQDILATNLTAPFLLVRHAVKYLVSSSGASIVNIGSILGS